MMFRNFVITLAMVIGFGLSLASNAEAARHECTCTSAYGTLNKACPRHRGECAGLPQHNHERGSNYVMGIPTLCEVENQFFMVDSPTCRPLKQQIREQKRAQRRMEREHRRNRGDNFLVETFNRRVERNTNRIEREIRSDIRRDINRHVDRWFGF